MSSHTIDKDVFLSAIESCDGRFNQDLLANSRQLRISIDSRTLKRGDIFMAIKGELHDGHDFIADAIKKHASLIIADRSHSSDFLSINVPIFYVEDTLKLFGVIACHHLRSCQVIKVAVTGSNGKTTTKEMLKAALTRVLGSSLVFASHKNLNNHFGVPLNALQVSARHQIAIFEMGMNHAGEIAELCRIIEPDVGIITNIGHAHEGNFIDGIDGVQRAKGELFAYLAKTHGRAVVNIDDDRIAQEAEVIDEDRRFTFGARHQADIKLLSCKPCSDHLGQELSLKINEQAVINARIPLLGHHNAINAACALAGVHALDLSVADGALGLNDTARSLGRMDISISELGYLVINDGYNANPSSMSAGILASLSDHGFTAVRRIAAIGAMGELGAYSDRYHFDLGQLLASHFDFIFICGASAQFIVDGALSHGLAPDRITFVDTSAALIAPLKKLLRAGDLIFIKGSHSYDMQTLADAL